MSQKSHGETQEKTSCKRVREIEDDSCEGEKFSKIEKSEVPLAEQHHGVIIITDDESSYLNLNYVKSNIFVSRNRFLFADFIWKVEAGRDAFPELALNQKVKKNSANFSLACRNIFYSGSNSSSLIFAFQNGEGLSEEALNADLDIIESALKLDEVKMTPTKETESKIHSEEAKQKTGADDNCANLVSSKKMNNLVDQLDRADFPQITINTIRNLEAVKQNQYENAENNETVSIPSQKSSNAGVYSNSLGDLNSEISSNLVSNRTSQDNSKSNSIENSQNGSVASNGTSSGDNNNSQSQNSSKKSISPLSLQSRVLEFKDSLKGNYHTPDSVINLTEYSPTFDISIHLTIVEFKSITITFKDVRPGEILLEEIPLNSAFYSRNLPSCSEVKIIAEVAIRKHYNENTGYTGIINEAMTCYMNSMLQTLNVLGYFKKAVFQIPTWQPENTDNSSMAVAYSLQRLFFDLKQESSPVSTNQLTHSFGWSRDQIFVQHDVQEFNLLLSDVMEKNMKGTPVEGTFTHLFAGKTRNYIECLDVDYKSNKVEAFCDLQLTVKGCKNLYESFEKYTEEEVLDNDDKYQTESYGKQRAKKGIKFLKIPNVLILQLKRFEYNPRRDSMEKINDYFEYFDELDLTKFVCTEDNSEENSDDNVFSLHSVVVHKGGINCGHYFAYIRPECNDNWIMFNDETVRDADWDEVFTNNFGGVSEIWKHRDRGNVTKINSKPDANAYILVYIRKSKCETILCNVGDNDIPDGLKALISKDKADERKREILRRRERDNMDVHLIVKENILKHSGVGISPSASDLEIGDNLYFDNFTKFNLPKSLPIKDFLNFIHESTRIPIKAIDLYCYSLVDPSRVSKRFNFRMFRLSSDFIETKAMQDIKDIISSFKFCYKHIFLYIDVKLDDISILESNPNYSKEKISNDEEDEYEYICRGEESNGEIIYSPKNNKFTFKLYPEGFFDECQSFNSNKIIFLKYLKHDQESNKLKFVIDEVAHFEWQQGGSITTNIKTQRDYKEMYKKYLSYFPEMEPSFLLEKTSAEYEVVKAMPMDIETNSNDVHMQGNEVNTLENLALQEKTEAKFDVDQLEEIETNSDLIVAVEDFDSLFEQNKELDAFVIIVNLKRKVDKTNISEVVNAIHKVKSSTDCEDAEKVFNQELKCTLPSFMSVIIKLSDRILSKVFAPIIYISDKYQKVPIAKEKKFELLISEDEDEVKERLFKLFKTLPGTFEEILADNFEVFYLTTDRRLIPQSKFIDELSLSQFNILEAEYNKVKSTMQEIRNFPLTKFIGVERRVISHQLYFNILPAAEEEASISSEVSTLSNGFYHISLLLFDVDNNPINKVVLNLPNGVDKCEDIVAYIYDPVITAFYEGFVPEQFFFLIQHRLSTFAYDLFHQREAILTQYERNQELSLQYRIQPYRNEEIEEFNCKTKVFVALATREGNSACDPFIIYAARETVTVKEIKLLILSKMQKIKSLQDVYGELSLQIIKFYTYTLINYRPNKDILLLNTKDDDLLFNFFKNRGNAPNLLVEFLIPEKVANKNGPSHAFLSTSENLSFESFK